MFNTIKLVQNDKPLSLGRMSQDVKTLLNKAYTAARPTWRALPDDDARRERDLHTERLAEYERRRAEYLAARERARLLLAGKQREDFLVLRALSRCLREVSRIGQKRSLLTAAALL
jgi:hypothetical protein